MNIESIVLLSDAIVRIYNQTDRMGDMELVENSVKELNAEFLNNVHSYMTIMPATEETPIINWDNCY